VGSLELTYICEIVPEKNVCGAIKEYSPHKKYINAAVAKIHKFGMGPFCKFRIPANLNLAGVYAIKVEDSIKYVGECESLSWRFNTGYGNISPRNCFVGGQSTNCKINSYILKEKQKGRNIHLYFIDTDDRFSLERELIDQYKPEWNSTAGKTTFNSPVVNREKKTRVSKGGKYEPLKNYLTNCSSDSVELTYKAIEKIIENGLPCSAFKYLAWWANGGHTHADAWLGAGFRVDSVNLGQSVVFAKSTMGCSKKGY
jgi:hypothetical protein